MQLYRMFGGLAVVWLSAVKSGKSVSCQLPGITLCFRPVNPRGCHLGAVSPIFFFHGVYACQDLKRPEPLVRLISLGSMLGDDKRYGIWPHSNDLLISVAYRSSRD
jgi:hypothetical protein